MLVTFFSSVKRRGLTASGLLGPHCLALTGYIDKQVSSSLVNNLMKSLVNPHGLVAAKALSTEWKRAASSDEDYPSLLGSPPNKR